jgi:hypothetical protein
MGALARGQLIATSHRQKPQKDERQLAFIFVLFEPFRGNSLSHF